MAEQPNEVQGAGHIDRALTVATRSRTRRGRGAKSTRVEYAREWGRWESWCHPPAVDGRRERWLDPTDVTPELLATYAVAQCDAGVAVGTVRKAMAAIRSELRSRGLPVPDGVPAFVVLREIEDTRVAAGQVPKRAEPLMLDGFVRLLAVPDPTPAAGARDRAMWHLLYAGLRSGELAALNLGHFTPVDADEPGELGTVQVDVPGRDRPLILRHWRSTAGVHDPRLCPVEAVMRWHGWTAGRPGASPGWPFLRAVDGHGRINGLDPGWSGPVSPDGPRLTLSKISAAFARATAAAGLAGTGTRLVPLSLVLGGTATRLEQGAPGLGAFVDGRWSPTSALVGRFLERYTPDDAGDIAVTWSPRDGGPDAV